MPWYFVNMFSSGRTKVARLFCLCGSVPQCSDPAFDITSPLIEHSLSIIVSHRFGFDEILQTHHTTLPHLASYFSFFYSQSPWYQPLEIPYIHCTQCKTSHQEKG